MKLNRLILIAIIILSSFGPIEAFAHPGRTDTSGCHTCRTNCPNWGLSYGEYHCHRAKALPQPIDPIKSHRSIDGGTGYTEPAPEYRQPARPSLAPKTKVSLTPVPSLSSRLQPKTTPLPNQNWLERFLKWLAQ